MIAEKEMYDYNRESNNCTKEKILCVSETYN